MKDFKDKVIVITGGSRGIGRACCLKFAKEKANIVFTYNKSQEKAQSLSEEIKKQNVEVLAVKVDIKNYSQCQDLVEKVLDKFGKVDVLINNAGIIKDKAMMMMSESDWLEVINTNLNGTFNMSKSFIITFMKQKQGNLINISSVSGIIGMPRQVNYSASKGGIIAFSRALAREVAQFNIRVNVIAPGFIRTDMLAGLKKEHVDEVMSQIPLGRFGNPEEVAEVAVFLASERSSYITSQIIRIDGGLGM